MIDPITFAPVKGGTEWWYINPAVQQKTDANSIRISGFNGDLSAAVPGTALRIRQFVNANVGQHVWFSPFEVGDTLELRNIAIIVSLAKLRL